jgi:molybdenum cofactor cytidylyltransferase
MAVKAVRKVAGIILAAGEGSRMGRTKQLLPFRGKTILECVVDNALAAKLDQVVVVLGHQAELLMPLLEGKGVDAVVNPRYREGQSTSLKAGLAALPEEVDAVLFLLGDQPLITPALIDQIVAAYQTSGSPIVMPVNEGKRGNPVLFSRETFAGIQALSDDCGARPLFQEYASRLLALPVADTAIHFDIDTEEDYERLLLSFLPPLDP